MDNETILNIDSAIHNPHACSLTIKGINYPVSVHEGNGCRILSYAGTTFMEQNKRKASKYGTMARSGVRITWGIRPSKWIQIINNQIIAN